MPHEPHELHEAQFLFTTTADGDLGLSCQGESDVPCDEVEQRRRRVLDRPWSWLRQVHGSRVVQVTSPGGGAGERADAAFTTHSGVCLCAFGADCAPVVVIGAGGYGIAHAGWPGVRAGLVGRLVNEMRAAGVDQLRAHVGPSIGPECYEFGPDLLDVIARQWGDGVRGRTSQGRPALNIAAALSAQLNEVGVDVESVGPCTACSPRHFSHRARRDVGRHAGVVWT